MAMVRLIGGQLRFEHQTKEELAVWEPSTLFFGAVHPKKRPPHRHEDDPSPNKTPRRESKGWMASQLVPYKTPFY